MSDFVHLHSHTMFSLLDGAVRIKDMAERAAEWGMPAMAMTDHGNLFGAIEFYKAAKEVGVKPIIGCEVYCATESRHLKKSTPDRPTGSHHLVLLAKDDVGYHNLIRLVSLGYLEGFYYNPRIDKDLLRQHNEGLVCLSACVSGEIPYLINRKGVKAAKKAVEEYQDIFGEDFYLEIQRHGIDLEDKINPGLIKLHKEMGVPLVATNDSHFLKANDHEAHAALVAIQTGKTLDDPNRMCYPTGVYFKSADEMKELFKDLPNAVETSLEIAEKCNVEISFDEYHAPDFPLPTGYTTPLGYLEHRARAGLEERLGDLKPEYEERLKFELDVIEQTGYPGYFLILGDLVDFSKREGIRAGARGSAVSSLVAYGLGITTVDPIEYGLVFERFLNPERISPPDIDYDIADRDREKVIQYVVDKYGKENVCQIITFGTMGAKAVIRDVARVMNLPFTEGDRISKLVPAELKMTLEKALGMVPELRQISEDGGQGEKLLKIAQQLEGMARHASIHAAAVVITPKPLLELMPLYKAPKDGHVMTQWNWREVEELGFLKMDFLGLRNLTVIDDTVKMVKENHGVDLDVDNLPLDDGPTFELFGRGDTTGVFQFESPGMKSHLAELKPDKIGDIIALNALYRPGPMKYIPNYIARKNGREPVRYYDEKMKPALEETYGIITYQEQVQRLCRDIAGFTLGKADGIRKAMGKKLADVMEKYRQEFLDGAVANDTDKRAAEDMWADIEVFSGYGFNKAHSSGYSMVAYQCAYLKAHYPSEFMAANLNSEIGDIDRLVTLIDECRRMDLAVLPPDINESIADFIAVSGNSVRMGMAGVRNVGRSAVDAIVAAREDGGLFTTLFDFCERVDLRSVNRRAVESLIYAGAFDCAEGSRSQLAVGLETALDSAQAAQDARRRGQISLFGSDAMAEQAAIVNNHVLPSMPEWPEQERLTREKEVLGFYLVGHPLDSYRAELENLGVKSIIELDNLPDSAAVNVAGIITEVKPHTDRKGRQMAFGALEDALGSIDLVLFPDSLEKVKERFVKDALVVMSGRLSSRNARLSVMVDEIMPIEQAQEKMADAVNVLLPAAEFDQEKLESLRNLVANHPGDCALYLHLQMDDKKHKVIKSRRFSVTPSETLFSSIHLLGGEHTHTWISTENGRRRRAAVAAQAPKGPPARQPQFA